MIEQVGFDYSSVPNKRVGWNKCVGGKIIHHSPKNCQIGLDSFIRFFHFEIPTLVFLINVLDGINMLEGSFHEI